MSIAPNEQFQLHAHPNLELIWVVGGAMHEYRLSVLLIGFDFSSCFWALND